MESCCENWERLEVWLWTHIPIWVGGAYIRAADEESHTHADTSQQVVDLAADGSGDGQNNDQAEGGSLLDERGGFDLDDGACQEPSFPQELRKPRRMGSSIRSADIARFLVWARWIIRAGGSPYGSRVDQCRVRRSGV